MVRFLLVLVSWLMSTAATVLVTYIVSESVKEFWGKPMMEILKEFKEDKED